MPKGTHTSTLFIPPGEKYTGVLTPQMVSTLDSNLASNGMAPMSQVATRISANNTNGALRTHHVHHPRVHVLKNNAAGTTETATHMKNKGNLDITNGKGDLMLNHVVNDGHLSFNSH